MTPEEIDLEVVKYNLPKKKPKSWEIVYLDGARSVIEQILRFFEEYKVEDASLSITENYGDYELVIQCYVDKTYKELEQDILWHKKQDSLELDRKRTEYERLKKLFEGETK